jgi:fatty-acyl-CoA synthase
MIDAFREDYQVDVLHAWGMTELSPLGTVCTLKNKHLSLPAEGQMKLRMKQGRCIFGIDMKIVDAQGHELPHDGKAAGDLMVQGPWVIASYYKQEGASPLVDGWFPTGDVATIDADGFMQITDRSKDVIKSGGESPWRTPAWPWPRALACVTPNGMSARLSVWSKSPEPSWAVTN